MRTFEVQDGVKVTFYSPEEYKTDLGGSVEGEFVAAMESHWFLYEDSHLKRNLSRVLRVSGYPRPRTLQTAWA